MEVITIESGAFKEIRENLDKLRQEFEQNKIKQVNDVWLSSKQVQEVLGISQKTWQTYRDKRLIKFSQVGQKIYVKASWLENFLENNSKENTND